MAKMADGGATRPVTHLEDGSIVATEDEAARQSGDANVGTPAVQTASPLLWRTKDGEPLRFNFETIGRAFDHYGLPSPTSEEAEEWSDLLNADGAMVNAFETYLRNMARGMYPQFSAEIESGVPPRVLLSPFLRMAENELGRKVSVSDDIVQGGLFAARTESKAGGPTLAEFRNYLRALPEWEQGPVAQRELGNLMAKLEGL